MAPPQQPARRAVTVLESVEELRSAVRAAQTVRESALAPPPAAPPPAAVGDDTRPYRPSLRPPMALLCVLDDGDDDGEWHRLRGPEFVIGRAEGDLVIPHDHGMSGRHAEVARRLVDGQHRWQLRDLNSTNGTFARASTGLLTDGQELLLGGRRFRFDAPRPPALEDAGTAAEGPARTQKWQAIQPGDLARATRSSLVELTPHGEAGRTFLDAAEYWIGRDPARCNIVLDDPMVSPRHARLHRDERGRWIIQNARSLNGLWLKVAEIALDRGGQFQCGEQRFLFRVL